MRGLRGCGHLASTTSPRQPGAITLITSRKRSLVTPSGITTQPRIAAVLVDEKSMSTNSQAVEAPHRSQQEIWVRFAKKASRFSSLLPLLWRLSNAGSATVLVDELEAAVSQA